MQRRSEESDILMVWTSSNIGMQQQPTGDIIESFVLLTSSKTFLANVFSEDCIIILYLRTLIYLNSICRCVSCSLAAHELEAIPKPAQKTCQEGPPSSIPVVEVSLEGRFRKVQHRAIEETDVQNEGDEKARHREIEESSVNRKVRDPSLQSMPLIVCGQVKCGWEEGEAKSGEESYHEPNHGALTKHLQVKSKCAFSWWPAKMIGVGFTKGLALVWIYLEVFSFSLYHSSLLERWWKGREKNYLLSISRTGAMPIQLHVTGNETGKHEAAEKKRKKKKPRAAGDNHWP